MSKAIKKQLKPNKIELSDAEFAYISSLDAVAVSFNHYHTQLKRDYLHTLTLKHGYTVEDNVELSIDLKSEDHVLTITPIKA